MYHNSAVDFNPFCTRVPVDLRRVQLEQRFLTAYLSLSSLLIAMNCSSLNLDCRMSVSSAMNFPIRRGSQGSQVSGINASVYGNPIDVRAIGWRGHGGERWRSLLGDFFGALIRRQVPADAPRDPGGGVLD